MRLKQWDALPPEMQTDAVRPYYDSLKKKRISLFFKRVFDIFLSLLLLAVLSPVYLILAFAIKVDSPGPIFFRQVRVTQYGKRFRIFKFRTMVRDADKLGAQVTSGDDLRVTRVGRVIRKFRLDETCQAIDILRGTMTFVGTRPEVPRYVAAYTQEMMATLLLPAGVTSMASIAFKGEEDLLSGSTDPDETYIRTILPQKMALNLAALRKFSFLGEFALMVQTIFAVARHREEKYPSAAEGRPQT